VKKLILISGKAGCGKNQFADYIKEYLESQNQRVVITAFARHIKSLCKEYLGWNGEKTDYWRSVLQRIGTDVIRNEMRDVNFHVNRMCKDILILFDEFDYFIVPDTRFPNECELPKSNFGSNKVIDVRLVRPNYESNLTFEQQQHESETALDDYKFSYTVINYGDLVDLKKVAIEFCDRVLGGKRE